MLGANATSPSVNNIVVCGANAAAPSAYTMQMPQHHQRIPMYETLLPGIFRDSLTVLLSLWENIRVIVKICGRCFFVGVLMPANIYGHIRMGQCNNLGLISAFSSQDALSSLGVAVNVIGASSLYYEVTFLSNISFIRTQASIAKG